MPDEDDLLADLKTLRRRGISKLSQLDLPALRQAVRASGRVAIDEPVGAFAIEAMLRDAVSRIGGDKGDAATIALGLDDGGRSASPAELRREGASLLGVGVEQFRHEKEPEMFGHAVQLLLGEAHQYRLRLARLREDVRTPVGSRLAVEWLSRFEAMYAIWSPVSGVGNDLTAYRATLLEQDRPYDREPDPADAEDDGYTQEWQAAGYITSGFFHFTKALVAQRRFEVQFGGLWLLPDAQAETDLRDAWSRIVLASPNNERDDSYMRMLLSKIEGHEQHGFLRAVAADKIAMASHDEWQTWSDTCECEWPLGERVGREPFPTHRNHPDISARCDLHTLIAACSDFCLTLDDAWDQIADWYRDVPRPVRRDATAEELYCGTDVDRR